MEKKERYEIHIYDDVCVDLYNNGVLDKSINDTYKLEKLLNQQDKENQQLKQQLEEKEKTIQSYEKIVEQKDEEIRFANRDKIYIVKQLNDPKDYVLLEDYKKVEHQIKDKEQENERLKKEICKYEITLMDKNSQLKQQLHDLPKKIVEEIRKELVNIVEVGDYFDTEIDEETNLLKQSNIENILDAILKKYGDKQ